MKNIKGYTEHLTESGSSHDSAIDELKERLWVAYFTEGGKHHFISAYDDATEAENRRTRDAGRWNEEEIEEEMGFERDGMQLKCRLTFGAKAADWRGIYMNDGN